MAVALLEGILDVPQMSLLLAALDLIIGEGGAAARAPVDDVFASIDEAPAVESDEGLSDGAGEALVHGEAFALPVTGAAEPLELIRNRAAALLLDLTFLFTAIIAVVVLLHGILLYASLSSGAWLAGAAAVLAVFVIRMFYFIYFELRSGGSTPGKKRLGLRIVSRDGGPLTAGAVCARSRATDQGLAWQNVSKGASVLQGAGLGQLERGWPVGCARCSGACSLVLSGRLVPGRALPARLPGRTAR